MMKTPAEHRTAAGLTQMQAAVEADLSLSSVQAAEAGGPVGLKVLRSLAALYRISLDAMSDSVAEARRRQGVSR